jgi:hypothetical protein
MIFVRASQCFSIVVAVFNVCMAYINFLEGDYRWVSINGGLAIALILLVFNQERMFMSHRRGDRMRAQKQLDMCWNNGICPDCGKSSLALLSDEEVMCSEIGCNSHFRCDLTGKWSRI